MRQNFDPKAICNLPPKAGKKPRGRPKGSRSKSKLEGMPKEFCDLSLPKQDYVLARVGGLNQRQSLKKIGYSVNNVSRFEQMPDVQAAFKALIHRKYKKGEQLIQTLEETRTKALTHVFASKDGVITDSRQVLDRKAMETRADAAKSLIELGGYHIPKSIQENHNYSQEKELHILRLYEKFIAHLPTGEIEELARSSVPLTIEAEESAVSFDSADAIAETMEPNKSDGEVANG